MFTRLKCGLILQIFCCGFMGKMRMRTDFYVLFILERQAYITEKLLRTEEKTVFIYVIMTSYTMYNINTKMFFNINEKYIRIKSKIQIHKN